MGIGDLGKFRIKLGVRAFLSIGKLRIRALLSFRKLRIRALLGFS